VPLDADRNIRTRVDDPALLRQWQEMLDARQISQQRAVVALMRFVVEQDPLAQLMIFGQAPADDHAELTRIVLRRLAKPTRSTKSP
jgi:hypothetical protein